MVGNFQMYVYSCSTGAEHRNLPIFRDMSRLSRLLAQTRGMGTLTEYIRIMPIAIPNKVH